MSLEEIHVWGNASLRSSSLVEIYFIDLAIDLSPKWPPQIYIKLSGQSIPAHLKDHLGFGNLTKFR